MTRPLRIAHLSPSQRIILSLLAATAPRTVSSRTIRDALPQPSSHNSIRVLVSGVRHALRDDMPGVGDVLNEYGGGWWITAHAARRVKELAGLVPSSSAD